MNLNAIAGGCVAAVNPYVMGAVQVSTGSTVAADGSVTPTFATFPGQRFQVQALSPGQLRHAEFLNLQGVLRTVYLNGNIEGLDRPAGKGGDLLLFNGQTWLVVDPSEQWDANGWTKVIVALQVSTQTSAQTPLTQSALTGAIASLPTAPTEGAWLSGNGGNYDVAYSGPTGE